MAVSALLRALRRRDLSPLPALSSRLRFLSGNASMQLGASRLGHRGASLVRPFSSKPAGNDIIGIDLGTTNSCVAVMEGKVAPQSSSPKSFFAYDNLRSSYHATCCSF